MADGLRSRLKRVPPLYRAVQSVKWLGHVWRTWRSPSRVFLSYPPGHFYSPLPDPGELSRDTARIFADPPTLPGIDLNRDGQQALLDRLAEYQADLPFGPQPRPGLRYHFENSYFSYPDGVLTYSLMRHLRPPRVVEVGCGFSSAVMLDTDEQFLGGRTAFSFIDPDTTRLDELLRAADRSRCRVIPSRVQDAPQEVFAALRAGDWLFIDSSHVTKAGSDVNYIFLDILPTLPPGVVVHVHDVFWPFEYPREWFGDDQGRAWNEAYLVRALLTGGRRYEVLCFGSYLERHVGDDWVRALPQAARRAEVNPHVGASSLWLRVRGG